MSEYNKITILFAMVALFIGFQIVPYLLIFTALAYSFFFIGKRNINFDLNLYLYVTVVVLLQWLIISLYRGLFIEDGSSSYFFYNKLAILIVLGSIYSRYIFSSNFFKNLPLTFYILVTLVMFSFVRSSAGLDIAIKYLLNTYFPLFFLYLLFFVDVEVKSFNINRAKLDFTLLFLILINLLYVVLDYLTCFDFSAAMSSVLGFFREDSVAIIVNVCGMPKSFDAGTVTNFIGFDDVIRVSGIIGDFILAGHFWGGIAFYILYFSKFSKPFRLLFATICVFFLVISLSKGAIIALFSCVIIYQIINNSFNKVLKSILCSTFVIFMILFLIIISIGSNDSSSIHYLGLIGPFEKGFNFNYVFGNDLHSGGNLSNQAFSEKLSSGAESFIGLLMHNVGILGVVMFIIIHLKIVISAVNRDDKFYSAGTAIVLSMFIPSFLQENVYNLSYIAPKILVIFFLFFSFSNSKVSMNEN